MDERPQLRNNPPISFNIREFAFGLAVAVAVVLAVAVTRHYTRAHTPSAVSACYANLKQLEGAKSTWAIGNKKGPQDVPTWSDIVGPEAYLSKIPVCPQGGTYTIGPVGQPPRCSIANHVLSGSAF